MQNAPPRSCLYNVLYDVCCILKTKKIVLKEIESPVHSSSKQFMYVKGKYERCNRINDKFALKNYDRTVSRNHLKQICISVLVAFWLAFGSYIKVICTKAIWEFAFTTKLNKVSPLVTKPCCAISSRFCLLCGVVLRCVKLS